MSSRIPSVIPEFCGDCKYFDQAALAGGSLGQCNFYGIERPVSASCYVYELISQGKVSREEVSAAITGRTRELGEPMRRNRVVAALLILVVLAFVYYYQLSRSKNPAASGSGAGSQAASDKGSLTTVRAQKTVNLFVQHHEGSIQVRGVREIPQQNSAVADLDISGLLIPGVGTTPHPYSGPGIATFSHYTDGRWALTRIQVTNDYFWWDIQDTVE
jgi:hypothetical protein